MSDRRWNQKKPRPVEGPSLFDPPRPDVEPPRPALDRNVAPVGRAHPATAKAAAERAMPRTGTKRRAVFDLVREHERRTGIGLTAEQVGATLGWPHQSYSAAVSTLAADGWLVDSGERRKTDSGNEAIVWVVA